MQTQYKLLHDLRGKNTEYIVFISGSIISYQPLSVELILATYAVHLWQVGERVEFV